MSRTFATATAIATTLIAMPPAADAGQMINGPTPQANVTPDLPAVTPRPDVSRVLKRDEADDGAGKEERADTKDQPASTGQVAEQPPRNERTEALTERAPVPPDFPETLVKAMERPPFKPGDEPDWGPLPAPADDDDADDGHADHVGDAGEIDTGGSDGDAPGTGDAPPLGQNDADRLREQFRGGVGVERAEEIARLKEMQENGWLEFREGAFGGDGDCGPGVNLPAGTDLHGLGCDGGGSPETDSRPDRDQGFLGGMPLDPEHGHGGYPRPSPEDGMGSNREHDKAWIGGGGGSASGTVGIKDFGQGRSAWGPGTLPRNDPDNSSGECDSDCVAGIGRWVAGKATGKAAGEAAGKAVGKTAGGVIGNLIEHLINPPKAGDPDTDNDGNPDHSPAELRDDDGSPTEEDTTGDGIPDMSVPPEDDVSAGGEAGQPDPRGDPQGGGGAGGDCLTLGIRCDVAESESGETLGEKMKEWARTNGLGSGGLTPGKVMEQAGQPVPVPGRDSATGEVADPRTEAGLTPGCDAGPGGCAGGGDGGAGGTEAAGAAADDALDDAALDTSIAGITPGCDADPGGCGGRMGAAAEAAVESGAGEAAR